MPDENLSAEADVTLQIGHLLVVWDILANKLSGGSAVDELGLSEEERRALWALEDLCERGLADNGIVDRPEKEWDELIERAREFVKTVPVEFLD